MWNMSYYFQGYYWDRKWEIGWGWGKILQSLLVLLRFSYFSWISTPWVYVNLQLISRVSKCSFWPFLPGFFPPRISEFLALPVSLISFWCLFWMWLRVLLIFTMCSLGVILSYVSNVHSPEHEFHGETTGVMVLWWNKFGIHMLKLHIFPYHRISQNSQYATLKMLHTFQGNIQYK